MPTWLLGESPWHPKPNCAPAGDLVPTGQDAGLDALGTDAQWGCWAPPAFAWDRATAKIPS